MASHHNAMFLAIAIGAFGCGSDAPAGSREPSTESVGANVPVPDAGTTPGPFAAVSALPDAGPCHAATVRHIERPLSSTDPTKTFTYAFDYHPPKRDGAPTIVYLTGGPGQTSIGKKNSFPFDYYPPEYGQVYLDSRGVGCNSEVIIDAPETFFRSSELAADAMAVVQELKLDRYIVYGVSYGTLLASVTTHLIESTRAVTPPIAVILEGILGRAFTREESDQGYLNGWQRIRSELSPNALSVLDEESPLGLDGNMWGAWYQSRATWGTIGPLTGSRDYASAMLENLARGTPEAKRQELVKAVKEDQSESYPASLLLLHKFIMCHEISSASSTPKNELILVSGQMRTTPDLGAECSGIPLDRPFDSARYPLKTPTYYFEGEWDPATPFFQADYHFTHNVTSSRVFVLVKSAGHNPLNFNWKWEVEGRKPCTVDVYRAIAEAPDTLKEVVARCPLPSEVRLAAPQF